MQQQQTKPVTTTTKKKPTKAPTTKAPTRKKTTHRASVSAPPLSVDINGRRESVVSGILSPTPPSPVVPLDRQFWYRVEDGGVVCRAQSTMPADARPLAIEVDPRLFELRQLPVNFQRLWPLERHPVESAFDPSETLFRVRRDITESAICAVALRHTELQLHLRATNAEVSPHGELTRWLLLLMRRMLRGATDDDADGVEMRGYRERIEKASLRAKFAVSMRRALADFGFGVAPKQDVKTEAPSLRPMFAAGEGDPNTTLVPLSVALPRELLFGRVDFHNWLPLYLEHTYHHQLRRTKQALPATERAFSVCHTPNCYCRLGLEWPEAEKDVVGRELSGGVAALDRDGDTDMCAADAPRVEGASQ